MDTQKTVFEICKLAKDSSRTFAAVSTQKKNLLLEDIARVLEDNCTDIIEENKKDLASASENGVPPQMLDRLMLNEVRINGICSSLRALISLKDPVGSGELFTTPNGLKITCSRVPLGVVAIIFEARPNVTVDAAALCLKTGNAVILRGGKEAANTNRMLVSLMKSAIDKNGISPDILGFIDPSLGHEGADALMQARGLVDLLVPRGSKRLISAIVEKSKVPVIETGAGNCHLYVDASADLDMAVDVAINAKCSRPAVCNAIETLLVHASVAGEFLPKFAAAAAEKYTLELRGCPRTREILGNIAHATDSDYETEYDDYILAVKIVDSLGEAVSHINKYNTGHSEAIITNDRSSADTFKQMVDAAAVYVNASTRFTDGGEFGFGAEIGISTQKLHARGPMGLYALTTQKYLIEGDGQVR